MVCASRSTPSDTSTNPRGLWLWELWLILFLLFSLLAFSLQLVVVPLNHNVHERIEINQAAISAVEVSKHLHVPS